MKIGLSPSVSAEQDSKSEIALLRQNLELLNDHSSRSDIPRARKPSKVKRASLEA